MADSKPTTKSTDLEPADTVQPTSQAVPTVKEREQIERKARDAYGKSRGLDGKALQEKWDSIPDGLREAYRIQVR